METLISKSTSSLVYVDQENKMVRKEYLNSTDGHHEIELLSKYKLEGCPKFIKSEIINKRTSAFIEYFPGICLQKFMLIANSSLQDKIEIALNLGHAVKSLHSEGLVHQRLNPTNILVDLDTRKVLVHDFKHATKTGVGAFFEKDSWKDDVLHIAPEQTGRVEGVVTVKTDLYALGLCLYYIFFEGYAFDKGEFYLTLRANLAENPSIAFDSQSVPLIIQEIIRKLISKEPTKRYNSIEGLLVDLNYCLEKCSNLFREHTYQVGQFDFSSVMHHATVVQREPLCQQLNQAFQASQKGGVQLVDLTGEAGVGKTFLVKEWEKTLLSEDYMWWAFKSTEGDSLNEGVFLHGLITHLVDTLLTLPESEFKFYQKRVITNVGDQAVDLVQWVPQTKYILGNFSSQRLRVENLLSRLSYASIQFIQACMSNFKPLVLFCDDLQWADSWSHEVLYMLFQHVDTHHFLGILSHRSVGMSFPDSLQFDYTLQPEYLSVASIDSLLEANFTTKFPIEIAELIYSKTHGHPFFVQELINQAYRDKAISFNTLNKTWGADQAIINNYEANVNVGEYLSNKLSELSESEINILNTLAICGSHVSHHLLTHLAISDLKDSLEQLYSKNYLKNDGASVCFNHDLIRESILSTIDDVSKKQIHHTLAEIISIAPNLEMYPYQGLYHRLMGQGETIHTDELMFLCISAGNSLKERSNFEQARWYYAKVSQLVTPKHWEQNYNAILEYYNNYCECAFILRDYDTMFLCEQQVEAFAKVQLEKLVVNEHMLDYLSESHQFEETVAYLLKVLNRLGYSLKKKPSKPKVVLELLKLQLMLRGKKINEIANLPTMKDVHAQAFLKLTQKAATSIFGCAPDLLPIIIFKQTQLSLKYGNSVYSPYGYVSYGYAMSAFMKKVVPGDQFGKLAVQLIDKLNCKEVAARTQVIYYAFLAIVSHDWKASVDPLEKAHLHGMQSGDLFYASFARCFSLELRFLAGESLQALIPQFEEASKLVKSLKQELIHSLIYALYLVVDDLATNGGNEQQVYQYYLAEIAKFKEKSDRASTFNIGVYGIMYFYLKGNVARAMEFLELSEEHLDPTSPRQTCYSYFLLFGALVTIAGFREEIVSRAVFHKRVKYCLKNLKLLSKSYPKSYEHKLQFVKAYYDAVKEQKMVVEDRLWSEIIQKCATSQFYIDEAVAKEVYALLNIETGKENLGNHYLMEAYKSYQRWGCKTRVHYLEERYALHVQPVNDIDGLNNQLKIDTFIGINESLMQANSVQEVLVDVCANIMSNALATNVIVFYYDKSHSLVPIARGDRYNVEYLEGQNIAIDYKKEVVRKCEKINETIQHKSSDQLIVCVPFGKTDVRGYLYLEIQQHQAVELKLMESIANQLAISLENILVNEHKVALAVQEKNYKQELLKTSLHSQEMERQRLAMELHDGVGSDLAGIKRKLENYTEQLLDGTEKPLHQIIVLLNASCVEIRVISHNLSSPTLMKYGLKAAIEQLCLAIDVSDELQCKFFFSNWPEYLSRDEELMLFRIIQESVNNALKHAKPTEVFVQLISDESELSVTIEDNGCGFDKEKVKLGLGIQGIEARANALNAQFELSSMPEKGTSVVIHMPLN